MFFSQLFSVQVFAKEINTFDTIPNTAAADLVFTKVEVYPSFPGGSGAWNNYIKKIIEKNIDKLIDDNKSGTCRVRFIVDTNGIVSDVRVLNMKGSALAEIAADAIKNGPKWIPATQNGNTVKAYREQPLTFNIK